jgi:4-amino-4-deoxy-L-arabinose transferase-like glycosyltransferase
VTLTSDAPARGSEPRPQAPPPDRRLLAAGIVITILIGTVFLFYTKSDLWLDEALSVNVARLPLSQIPHWLRHDGAPPLYYVLLHFWMSIFGTSDEAVRSLSGVAALGSAVAIWYAGRRVSGTGTAWAALLLFMANPYVYHYATETRMYMIEILLVTCGFLAFMRALERPSIGRLAVLALITALLLYNQYWAIYLGIVVAALTGWMAWKGPNQQAARRMLVALGIGALAFVPWLPTFLYQAQHTGTPWGQPQLPPVPIGKTFADFAGSTQYNEGWVLFFPAFVMLLFGLAGKANDNLHVELDLRTRPPGRWLGFMLAAGLIVGTSLDYISRGAFQTRYSAFVFTFWLLLLAHGFNCLRDERVRYGVLAIMVAVGFIGGIRNAGTNRTEAAQVAAVLQAEAKPNDVVVYCPDQLGPAVHRLAPKNLDEFSYPSSPKPGVLVDWADYNKRIASERIPAFANHILAKAGDRTIWLVTAPGYRTHVGLCEKMASLWGKQRTFRQRVASNSTIYEMPGLQEFTVK